jgi:mutator protein MutT
MSIIIDKVIAIASALIKNKEGKILLLQRGESSSFTNHWQFVEGKLEDNEKIIEALNREIQEEIGVPVLDIELNSIFYNDLVAKGTNYFVFRVVFDVKIKSEDITLSNEHKSFGWFSMKEAEALPLLPGVKELLEKLTI